ncbi:MAG: T9SS type A sorting domain-containing protein [Bacteroidetes bacterium]|nr:T9SS type A sorting domain-containing protein [Bacteroidota bacterium]
MKKLYILIIACSMMNIVTAQQKYPTVTNKSSKPIKESLHQDFPEQKNPVLQKNHNLKTTNSIINTVDTIIAYDTSNTQYKRIIQIFNNYGKKSVETNEIWQNNSWINSTKLSYTYNVSGNLLTNIYEIWQNNNWIYQSRNSYTYYDTNANPNNLLVEFFVNNTWVNFQKVFYTYNTNKNLIRELTMNWNNTEWHDGSLDTLTYDTNGRLHSKLRKLWQNPWANEEQYIYTYDTNGNIITKLYEEYMNTYNADRYTYTYDTSGNMLSSIQEEWYNYYWKNSNKIVYTYDTVGNLLTNFTFLWENMIWKDNYKLFYTYDANNNLINEEYNQLYNNVYSFRYTFTYDTTGNSIAGKSELWQNNSWVLSPVLVDNLYVFSNKNIIYKVNWYPEYLVRYEASFGTISTGIKENNDINTFMIYPNPATSSLTINLRQLTMLQNTKVYIYDIQGKLLLQQAISQPQTELDIEQFAKGIYVVNIKNDKHTLVSKFVKE